MLAQEIREQEYAKVIPMSIALASLFTTDYEAARDLAGDAVIYVIEHEDRFDPERGFKFITFAGAYMSLFMKSQTRKSRRYAVLFEREEEDISDHGLVNVSSVEYDAAELAEQSDTIEYLRRVLFPDMSPACQRVFNAMLKADSYHAEDLVVPADVQSEGSVNVHKATIRKIAKARKNNLFKNLGLKCQ